MTTPKAPTTSQPAAITEAIRLFKAGDVEMSRQLLHDHLSAHPGSVAALLWLARVAPDVREAAAAAELALALQPDNETAQRAVAKVYARPAQARAPRPTVDAARLTGLTVGQARSIKWPFRGHNRPIGPLLDEGSITMGDIVWAFEKANDARIRQAARTILLAKLLGDNLQEPRLPLKVFERAGYTEYRGRLAALWLGLLGGAMAIALPAVVLLSMFAIYMANSRLPGTAQITIAASVATLSLLVLSIVGSRLVDDAFERSELAEVGAQGERNMLDILRSNLTSPWTAFHGLLWPDRKWGDVDCILVGPGGVWVFEVKAYRFSTRNIGDQWQYRGRWGWRKMAKHPGRQAQRNALNVKDYLDLQGVRLKWVQPVVVWAGDDSALTVEDPAVPVWRLSELTERMEALWSEQKLADDQVEKCAATLAQAMDAAAKVRADSVEAAPKPAAT